MSNCSYGPNGFTAKDREFSTALRSKNIVGCSAKFNNMETNDITVNGSLDVTDLTVDNLTVNNDATIGNDLAVGNDATIGNDLTAVGNGTFSNLNATGITGTTGNITTVNSTDVNTTDLTVTQNTTSQTYTVNPVGYPEYNLATVSGAEQNILAYGGDNTGTVDQTALVETLIDTAGVGGQTLFFPGGNYRFNTGITLPQNTRLVGDGFGNTIFNFYDNTPGNTMITLNLNDNIVENLFIRYRGTATDSILFGGNDLQRVQLKSIQTNNGFNPPAFWLVATGDGLIIITNSYISFTDTGIQISDTGSAIVTQNFFQNSGIPGQVAVKTLDTAKILVSNNEFQNNSTNLFEIASGGSVFSSNRIKNAVNVYTGAGVGTTTIIGSYGTELSNFQTGINVEGTQVISTQQVAIADDASGAVNQATVNAIIAALRAHGLIAT